MNARPAPFADLHTALDWLYNELCGAGDLAGTSPEYFCDRLLPILATLGDVVEAARTAIVPALLEEMHRANAAGRYCDKTPAGEV